MITRSITKGWVIIQRVNNDIYPERGHARVTECGKKLSNSKVNVDPLFLSVLCCVGHSDWPLSTSWPPVSGGLNLDRSLVDAAGQRARPEMTGAGEPSNWSGQLPRSVRLRPANESV